MAKLCERTSRLESILAKALYIPDLRNQLPAVSPIYLFGKSPQNKTIKPLNHSLRLLISAICLSLPDIHTQIHVAKLCNN
jgi:hypothetical protein